MKTIFSLRKHSYLKIIGTFIIAIALIAGVVGCEGEPGETYSLTMAVNPAGGGTATDETGTSPYTEGTVVNITAVAADCYRFADWTAPAGTFGDPNAATTTFTMPAQDVTVTANFEPVPPDHIKFYHVFEGTEPDIGLVSLTDQFVEDLVVWVGEVLLFGDSVEKEHATGVTPIADENLHYTYYKLYYEGMEEGKVRRSVEVSNQFLTKEEMIVWGPVALAVPTQKLVPGDHEKPVCANHFLVYAVDEAEWEEFDPVDGVNLKDQFIPDGEDVTVVKPVLFANPVEKTIVDTSEVTGIEDDTEHWVLFDIWDAQAESIQEQVQINNQFGDATLDLTTRALLAVPSQKDVPPTPPLDHFKCYKVADAPPIQLVEPLYLLDQFHSDYLLAGLGPLMMFCNPVDKVHAGVTTTSNDDNHLAVYWIETTTDAWTVTVKNQFGNDQELFVFGPVALAVPTQKLVPGDHGMPKYIDHYLLYAVEGSNVTATVDLDDQFDGAAPGVEVTQPIYFATPAIKGYVDHTGIWDPKGHLMFYRISENDEYYEGAVSVKNQFWPEEAANIYLFTTDQLLAVPSEKVAWEPYEGPL